jgi:hypothetical protein
MALAARVHLESLLRARKLDGTLTHVRPPTPPQDTLPLAWPELPELQALRDTLGGGLPRGELSEIAGPRSSGRTTLMCAALAGGTRAGEPAALVDALDRLDVESAAAAGVHLPNLLWVRGPALSAEAARAPGHAGLDRAVARAIKGFTLVIESRVFAVAVCDLADMPAPVLRRLPFTTWFRLARLVEGSRTAALLIAPERLGRSAGGVTLVVGETGASSPCRWRGGSDRARLFEGIVPRARVVRSGQWPVVSGQCSVGDRMTTGDHEGHKDHKDHEEDHQKDFLCGLRDLRGLRG